MFQELTTMCEPPKFNYFLPKQVSYESEDSTTNQGFSSFNGSVAELNVAEDNFVNFSSNQYALQEEYCMDGFGLSFENATGSQLSSNDHQIQDLPHVSNKSGLHYIERKETGFKKCNPIFGTSSTTSMSPLDPHFQATSSQQTNNLRKIFDSSSPDITISHHNFASTVSGFTIKHLPTLLSATNVGKPSSNQKKQKGTPGRKRKYQDHELSPEEAARRNIRRERNKVAAAKCRNRRRELTDRLQCETDQLEQDQQVLQQQIYSLQQEKLKLEQLLAAHKPLCKAGLFNDTKAKIEQSNSFASTSKTLFLSNSNSFTNSSTSYLNPKQYFSFDSHSFYPHLVKSQSRFRPPFPPNIPSQSSVLNQPISPDDNVRFLKRSSSFHDNSFLRTNPSCSITASCSPETSSGLSGYGKSYFCSNSPPSLHSSEPACQLKDRNFNKTLNYAITSNSQNSMKKISTNARSVDSISPKRLMAL